MNLLEMICEGRYPVSLGPTVDGLWVPVALFLLILGCVFAIISFWVSPVAAPFSDSEKSRAWNLPLWLLRVLPFGSAFFLFGSLFFALNPYGCATHAFLVSTAEPVGVIDFANKADTFIADVRNTARIENREVIDLSLVRDSVLDGLPDKPLSTAEEALIPNLVRSALDAFERKTLTASGAITSRRIESRIVETVDLAILMAWHARNPGPEQRISYLVSDRAEQRYGWDWQLIARNRFSVNSGGQQVANIKVINEHSDILRLNRVILARTATNGTSLVAHLLVEVPKDGVITFALIDSEGNLLTAPPVTKHIDARATPMQIIDIQFYGTDLNLSTRVVQLDSDSSAPIPPKRPDPVRVYFDAPTVIKQKFEETLSFLAGHSAQCAATGNLLMSRMDRWKMSFGIAEAGRMQLTSSLLDSDVIVHIRQADRALFIIPTSAVIRNGDPSPGTLVSLPFVGNKSPESVMQTELPTVPANTEIFVIWDPDRQAAPLTPGGLRLPQSAFPVVRTIPATTERHSQSVLYLTAESATEIDSYRLSSRRGAFAGAIEARFAAPDLAEPLIENMATLLALDFEKAEVLCGASVSEAERFFGIWRHVFRRIAEASTPRVQVPRTETASNDGAPAVVFSQPELNAIRSERIKLPLLVALGMAAILLTQIGLGYFRVPR